MRRLVASSSLLLALAASPDAAAQVSFKVERYVLDNGLDIILHEDHRTPVVAVNVWYHVGSKDEPAGRNGFAHLFEHLMYQGSKNVGEDEFAKYIERAGGTANGTTEFDRTNYYQTVPSNELALVLWLESDRMATLLDHVNPATFASQREVVLNEHRQNWENAPYGLVGPLTAAALYPKGHPYRTFPIGTPEDLDAATLDDVHRFFKTFYVPNNATIVIAGDVDPAQAKALVAKYFGPIPRGAPPPILTRPIEVTLAREERVDVEADVELPRLSVRWPGPALYAPGDAELDVAAVALAWVGKSSPLQRRLVRDLGLAHEVSTGTGGRQLGGAFDVKVTLKKGKSAVEALEVVDQELDKLRAHGPTAQDLARAKKRLGTEAIYGAEPIGDRADLLNKLAHHGRDPGQLADVLGRYERVSADDVKRAVVRWLPKAARVVTIVTPTPGAPRGGRLKGAP